MLKPASTDPDDRPLAVPGGGRHSVGEVTMCKRKSSVDLADCVMRQVFTGPGPGGAVSVFRDRLEVCAHGVVAWQFAREARLAAPEVPREWALFAGS